MRPNALEPTWGLVFMALLAGALLGLAIAAVVRDFEARKRPPS